jgi:hypothetical protein
LYKTMLPKIPNPPCKFQTTQTANTVNFMRQVQSDAANELLRFFLFLFLF